MCQMLHICSRYVTSSFLWLSLEVSVFVECFACYLTFTIKHQGAASLPDPLRGKERHVEGFSQLDWVQGLSLDEMHDGGKEGRRQTRPSALCLFPQLIP